jgi:hypothetical protein
MVLRYGGLNYCKPLCSFVLVIHLRACSLSSQSIWIEWNWMGLNPKQVKILHIFFQSPSNPYATGITEQALKGQAII